jgi:hypothetical protein
MNNLVVVVVVKNMLGIIQSKEENKKEELG